MPERLPPPTPDEVSHTAGRITEKANSAAADITAMAAELAPEDGKVDSPWERRLKVAVGSLLIILGLATAGQQYASSRRDENAARSEEVARCRSELRSTYIDSPRNLLDGANSRLNQIQAAGLEAVPASDGRSAETEGEPNPYSGLTLLELRDLSAEARVKLAAEQTDADRYAAHFKQITKLPTDAFLTECEKERAK